MNGQLLANARDRFQFSKQCHESAQNIAERLTEVRFADGGPEHASIQRQTCLDLAAALADALRRWVDLEGERLT